MTTGTPVRHLRRRCRPEGTTTVGAMNDVLTRPLGHLVTTTALVALAVTGCGADDEPEPAPTTTTTTTNTTKKADTARPRTRHLPAAPPLDDTVGRLDPDLRAALEAATKDALADGIRVRVTSGWRSAAHQQRLFDEAVVEYGSPEEASRWVSTPDRSAHVTGDAVDVGPTDAADWLGRHGSAYGLCQTFANESWHFELATEPGGECPAMLPDSSYR